MEQYLHEICDIQQPLKIPPMTSLAGVMNELLQSYGYDRSTVELRISNNCARNIMKSRYDQNEIT